MVPEITLRDYQAEALCLFSKNYAGNVNRQLLVAATGLGKTIIAGKLPERFPELMRYGMMFVVHTDELAQQGVDKLSWLNPMLRVGLEKAEYRADPSADIVVTSRQTLGRGTSSRLQRLMRHLPFGLVVVDEAHHVKRGGQYDNILRPLGLGADRRIENLLPGGLRRLLIGVTATPNRADGIGMGDFFDKIAANYDLRFGVTEGYLCDIEAMRIDTQAHIENVSTQRGDFAVGELSKAVNIKERNELVANAWLQHGGRSGLAFCVDVAHAFNLAATMREAGIRAEAVSGETPKEERRRIIERFQEGEIEVLTNCAVLTEGFDAPRADTILMCRPTKSTPLYVQILGRGTRTLPPDIGNLPMRELRLSAIARSEKPAMKLLDFCDIAGEHSIITAPSLFGLSPKFQGEPGQRMIRDVLPRYERLKAENPMKARRLAEAASFEEMEVEASKISVWDVATISPEIRRLSNYRWMQVTPGAYQLDVPAKRRFTVHLEENQLGQWACHVEYPRQYVEQADGIERIVDGEVFRRSGAYPSLEEAVRDMDRRISDEHSDVRSLIEHSPSWGKDPASKGQLSFMKRLGIDIPLGEDGKPAVTKSKASDAISAALALKKARQAREVEHAFVNP